MGEPDGLRCRSEDSAAVVCGQVPKALGRSEAIDQSAKLRQADRRFGALRIAEVQGDALAQTSEVLVKLAP